MLKFNTKIYKKKAIQQAKCDYAAFATFQGRKIKNHEILLMKPKGSLSKDFLENEFANYVLGLTKKCH